MFGISPCEGMFCTWCILLAEHRRAEKQATVNIFLWPNTPYYPPQYFGLSKSSFRLRSSLLAKLFNTQTSTYLKKIYIEELEEKGYVVPDLFCFDVTADGQYKCIGVLTTVVSCVISLGNLPLNISRLPHVYVDAL